MSLKSEEILNEEDLLKKEDLESLKRRIKKDYLKLLMIDPVLPKELLPDDWIGGRIKKIVKSSWV